MALMLEQKSYRSANVCCYRRLCLQLHVFHAYLLRFTNRAKDEQRKKRTEELENMVEEVIF